MGFVTSRPFRDWSQWHENQTLVVLVAKELSIADLIVFLILWIISNKNFGCGVLFWRMELFRSVRDSVLFGCINPWHGERRSIYLVSNHVCFQLIFLCHQDTLSHQSIQVIMLHGEDDRIGIQRSIFILYYVRSFHIHSCLKFYGLANRCWGLWESAWNLGSSHQYNQSCLWWF